MDLAASRSVNMTNYVITGLERYIAPIKASYMSWICPPQLLERVTDSFNNTAAAQKQQPVIKSKSEFRVINIILFLFHFVLYCSHMLFVGAHKLIIRNVLFILF